MNIETRKINEPGTCRKFVSELRNQVETKGYLTPQVERLLDYLNNNCANFNEQTRLNLGKQVVALSEDRHTPLQSLYVIGNILKGFDLIPEHLEAIGKNVFSFLDETYKQKFLLNEEGVDTRIAGWAILDEVVAQVSPELKANILQLSLEVGGLDNEDDFIQNQALQLSIKLTSQK